MVPIPPPLSTNNVYDLVKKQCALAPGAPCEHYYRNRDSEELKCVSNAQCIREHSIMDMDEFRENSISKDYRCKCKTGFALATFDPNVQSTENCYVMEGYSCYGDERSSFTERTCLPGLLCRDSKCHCLYKDHQKYHSDVDMCKSLVGGPCNQTADCSSSNAECIEKTRDIRPRRRCQCKTGFIQFGRECVIGFGEPCKQDDRSFPCDKFGPLECSTRNICECSDFQIYDNATRTCRGLVGAKCSSDWSDNNTDKFIRLNPAQHILCVGGATCIKFRGLKEKFGLCSCLNDEDIQEDGTCRNAEISAITTTNKP